MNQKAHRGWIASLSTGETVSEYQAKKGELTAWQSLLQRCTNENIKITQLRLQRSGITITSIPNAEGYYQAYEIKISHYRKQQTMYQGIGSISADHVFITWVNDQGDVFHDIRTLAAELMHTDRRKLVDVL